MHRPSYEYFDARLDGDVLILRVAVPMIRHPQPAEDFGAEVRAALAESKPRALLIDMRDVEAFGSTGFAVLMGLARDVTAAGGAMALCRLHEDVARGSSITGVARMAPCYATEREALAALRASATPAPGA